MNEHWTSSKIRDDWDRARRKALWEAVVDVLARRPGELVPLEEVRSRLNVRGSHYRGLQHVPLDKIVGSEGRYADFDRRFLPRRDEAAQRWMSINRANYKEVDLPPVELYKIGDVYFVKDGNHRVSVGRQRGQQEIDAYVTEYEVDVPLDRSFSMSDILLKEEYSDFLDWTQLARLRPQQRIELSTLGGYLDLINHINTHRYYLAKERGAPVSAEEAVESWYDNVYSPVVDAIRKHNILRFFPGRTEADLYLWIMQHRNSMRESAGTDPGAEAATLDYATRYRPRSVLGTVGEAVQTLASAALSLGRGDGAPTLQALDFIDWSRIDTLCPNVEIRLSNPEDYSKLRAHIEEHQRNLATAWSRPASLEEAVSDWCTHLYGPTIAAIREQNLLADWPGRTEADLYLEALDQLRRLEQQGAPADPRQVVASLRERLRAAGRSRLAAFTGGLRRLFGG